MPSTSRAAAALLVASGILLFAVSPSAAAPTPLSSDPAVSTAGAASWVGAQIGDDGLVESLSEPGKPDYGATAQAALALAITKTGRDLAAQAAAALSTHVDDYVVGGDPAADLPGNLAYLILLNEALGLNPRAFGGVDLVARLVATMQTSGPDAGLFGSQGAIFDGPFRQGLALAALSLVSPPPGEITGPNGAAGSLPVTWLQSQQCPDGSWMYRADLSTPCAFDPATFGEPDTNGTSLANLGLHAVGVAAGIDPLPWLTSAQSTTGGWNYSGIPSLAGDPDSTGLVLAAHRALGATAPDSATSQLLEFQFGCASDAADQGAYFYPPWDATPESPNLRATYDAVLGLASGVWPASLKSGTWAAALPTNPCLPPTTTTTTTTEAPTTTTTAAVTTTTVAATPVAVEAADETASTSVAGDALAATGTGPEPLAVLGLGLITAGVALGLVRRRVRH